MESYAEPKCPESSPLENALYRITSSMKDCDEEYSYLVSKLTPVLNPPNDAQPKYPSQDSFGNSPLHKELTVIAEFLEGYSRKLMTLRSCVEL